MPVRKTNNFRFFAFIIETRPPHQKVVDQEGHSVTCDELLAFTISISQDTHQTEFEASRGKNETLQKETCFAGFRMEKEKEENPRNIGGTYLMHAPCAFENLEITLDSNKMQVP